MLVGTFCGPSRAVLPDPAVLKLFEPVPGTSRRDHIGPAYYSAACIEQNSELLIAFTDRGTRDTENPQT